MKIIKLQAENVKKLSAVEITPQGHLVQITGRNGQGKSSVLDCIMWAIAGAKHIQVQPIRQGADTARIRLDLGELIVTRKFTASGSTITVENADGARYPSPQKMLDDLIGSLSFDPLAFTRMDAKAQAEELRRLVRLEVDVDALDIANKRDFDARTEVNRQVKQLRATIANLPPLPADLPAAKVDTAALVERIASAGEHNAGIDLRRERRAQAAAEMERLKGEADRVDAATEPTIARITERRDAEVASLEKQIAQLQARLEAVRGDAEQELTFAREQAAAQSAALRQQAADLQQRLDTAEPLPEPVDAAALRQELDRANQVNAAIAERTRRDALEADLADAEQRAASLTDAMEKRAAQKADALANAAMPIPGLSLGDGAVLFNGVPLDQASSAEQLRVSCAIAMAANPKLRVLRIKDGSLLDEDGLHLLAEMAQAHDMQVWLERVDSTGKVGIVLEDGAVVSAPAGDAPAGLFGTQAAE